MVNLASPLAFWEYAPHRGQSEQGLRAVGPEIHSLFLDEAQRVPELLDVVQVLVDEQLRCFHFFLYGSSARKWRRSRANLLPGRLHVLLLAPLLISEFGSACDIDQVIAHGTLPGIHAEEDPGLRAGGLRGSADSYLGKEVQTETLVRGGYGRLLELIAAASGRILNLNALCREADLSYGTVRRYDEVLEDMLLAFRVLA